MPKTQEFWDRIVKLEASLEQHLKESVHVHSALATLATDMEWLKKAMMIIVGVGTVAVGGILVQLFLMIIK